MEELIKVTEKNGEQLVSARELYNFLEVTERFSNWFERQMQFGFEENIDFTGCKFFNTQANQELQDYILKIDMAKELAMLSKSEKGKLIRKYCVELEKAWNSPEKVMARALQIANQQIETYKQQIEYQKPLVEFADKMLGSKDSLLVRVYAKLLNDEGITIS